MKNLLEFEEFGDDEDSGAPEQPEQRQVETTLLDLLVPEDLTVDFWAEYLAFLPLEEGSPEANVRDQIEGSLGDDFNLGTNIPSEIFDEILEIEGGNIHDGQYSDDEDMPELTDEAFNSFYDRFIKTPGAGVSRVNHIKDPLQLIDFIKDRSPEYMASILPGLSTSAQFFSLMDHIIALLDHNRVLDYEELVNLAEGIVPGIREELESAGFNWKRAKHLSKRARILSRG